jgi:hypothetical protein
MRNVGLDVVGEVEVDHGWCANSDLFAHRLGRITNDIRR